MPKETLCETRGNVRENGWKHVGTCRLRGFLRHLVTSFQASTYRRNNPSMSGNLHCYSRTFAIRNHSTQQFSRGTGCSMYMSLGDKCPSTEFFSGPYFPKFGQEKLRIWALFTQCVPGFILRYTWYAQIYLNCSEAIF